jgi:hypothetical protein
MSGERDFTLDGQPLNADGSQRFGILASRVGRISGFTAGTLRAALERAHIDVFVDTRRRRGVRGRQYAFANSRQPCKRCSSTSTALLAGVAKFVAILATWTWRRRPA